MTPIYIKLEQDAEGHGICLQIHSPYKSLHIAEYVDIFEGWLIAFKRQHKTDIDEFKDLKKSGKLVSIAEWKKQT